MFTRNFLAQLFHPFSNQNWGLFLAVLSYILLPKIYEWNSLYLIGNAITEPDALAVVSHWRFIDLAFEILRDALIFPLFYFIGRSQFSDDEGMESAKFAFIALATLSLSLTFLVWIAPNLFIEAMSTPAPLIAKTHEFLQIKIIALLFSTLQIFLFTLATALNFKRVIFIFTLIKILISISLDSFFFGNFNFSLNLGTCGVACSNALTELICFLSLLFFMIHICPQLRRLPNLKAWRIVRKDMLNIALWSATARVIRNVFYFALILKLLNEMGAHALAGYELTMQIIWGILLVPMLAYAEVCKATLSQQHSSSRIKAALLKMLLTTFLMTSIFFFTTPFWSQIANFFNADLKLVDISNQIYRILLPGYFLLSFSLITDSLFYAIGRPKYIAIQAIIVNFLVYLPAYIFYANDSWQPSMDSVMWLFVIGLICNTLVSIPLVWLAVSEKHKALTSFSLPSAPSSISIEKA